MKTLDILATQLHGIDRHISLKNHQSHGHTWTIPLTDCFVVVCPLFGVHLLHLAAARRIKPLESLDARASEITPDGLCRKWSLFLCELADEANPIYSTLAGLHI